MESVSQDYTESVLNDLNDLSDLGRTEHAFYIERQLIRQALLTCGGFFLCALFLLLSDVDGSR